MGVATALGTTLLVVESFTLPIFRSGGRTGLSFWGWVVNHTVFGPAVEYIPLEDYSREMEGLKIAAEIKQLPAPSAEELQTVMAYLKISELSARQLLTHQGMPTGSPAMLKQYYDLEADVRRDGEYHSVRELVQPDQEEVWEVARVLVQAGDFISSAQDFVSSFTSYRREIGDFWATPGETLQAQTMRREEGIESSCDCDDMAILLCSILRAGGIPPEDVFCAIGTWDGEGHMFLVMAGENGQDRIIEATAPSSRPVKGNYRIYALFNDRYTFAYSEGLREFCLKPVEEKQYERV